MKRQPCPHTPTMIDDPGCHRKGPLASLRPSAAWLRERVMGAVVVSLLLHPMKAPQLTILEYRVVLIDGGTCRGLFCKRTMPTTLKTTATVTVQVG